MKKIYKTVRVLFSFALFTSAISLNAQTNYCIPTWSGWAVNQPTEPISLVQFGSGPGAINNSSSNLISTDIPRYEDFSSISMNVQKGETYLLKVKGNTGQDDNGGDVINYITVYFDWNGDGVFSNALAADEVEQQNYEKHQYIPALVNSTGLDDIEVQHSVTIPQTAVLGSIRMRIVKNYNAPSNAPCSNPFIFGQVEDYTLNITEGNDIPNPEPVVCSDPGMTPGDIGCVTFTYNNVSTTYTTVRGADGQIWLQQNLGSTQVATSANDSSSYGDYYQWGRWADGHQLANSVISTTPPSPNNPTGLNQGNTSFYSVGYNNNSNWWFGGESTDTWSAENISDVTDTDGCDPCKAMGTDWRLPTIAEIEEMITAENISDFGASNAFNSNLKISSAGIKDYNGIDSQGVRAYFWSSTPIYTGSASVFYSGLAVTLAGYVGRDNGVPIRCIKKVQTQTVDECAPISTIDENFETFTAFPENCWTSNVVSPMIDLNVNSGTGNHSINVYSFMSPTEPIYIVSPELIEIEENQFLEFDILNLVNASTTNFTVGTMSNNTDFSTFTPVGNAIATSQGTHSSSIIPVIADHKYIAIKFTPNAPHQAVYLDNIKLKTPTANTIKFDQTKISIYPNPTTGIFYVESELEIKQIEVYNTIGQKLINTNQKEINLEKEASGIYLVKVVTNDGNQATYKVIKK